MTTILATILIKFKTKKYKIFNLNLLSISAPPTKHLTILTQRYMIRVLHGKKNRKGKEDPPIDLLGSNSQSK
jgi:hypothetical protein